MTVHFIHVAKTGGTAMKRALRKNGLAYWASDGPERAVETPFGRIELHHHRFRMRHVIPADYAFFCLRDPVARYFSAFHSRLNKGQPRYYFEWTDDERKAFETFPTPQSLATALASDDLEERAMAEWSMRHIRHLGFMERAVGSPQQLRRRRGQILYIARQETLEADWVQIKALFELPADVELPAGAAPAHRRDSASDLSLDGRSDRALRHWYARDYRLLEYCEHVRRSHGWVADRPAGLRQRLSDNLERLRSTAATRPRRSPTLHRRSTQR